MSTNKSKLLVIDPGLCRCCGLIKKCRFLNVEYLCMGQKEVYADLMMDCFGLLLSHLDGKPAERLICAACVWRLRDAFAFHKQVLRCEEAFLQMKMCQSDDDGSGNHLNLDEDNTKLEAVEVKLEPEFAELSRPDSPVSDGMDRDDQDYEPKPTDDAQSSDDDIPLSRRSSNLQKNKVKEKEEQTTELKECTPSASGQKIFDGGTDFKSKSDLMLKLQQSHRDRDSAYIIETNILNIIEYSYICPFKCRHSNLLCYYCGARCIDPETLRNHTHNEHHPKKFKVFEHRKMVKVDITRIDCRLCDEPINSLDAFKQHLSKIHKKKYYFNYTDSLLPFRLTKDEMFCALCDQKYPYFHALNKHMNVHFSNYVCETCGLGFVDNHRFIMHQQRHEVGDYPCETCGKVFKKNYNRELHIDRVHNKKGRVFCPKCDIKLMSYQQKLKHLVDVHGEAPLSFTCDLCDKIYVTRRMLTIHRRKEHLKDYRYECEYCGQKFFTRFALNNHMPTHTGERKFKCKVCEKSYPRKKTLKEHLRIHNNDRRYRCHICGQAFVQNCSLKGHIKTQHPHFT